MLLPSLAACGATRDRPPEATVTKTDSFLTVATEQSIGGPVAFPNPSDEFNPAVASDGTNFLVAWSQSQKGVVYKRVSGATGQPLDADGIVLDISDFASVAFGGGKFAVVGNYAGAVIASLINQDGTPATTFTLIASGTIEPQGSVFHPVVAWTGSNFLVVPDPARSFAARFSTTGQVLDPTPQQGLAPGAGGSLRIACGPTNCLLVSPDGRGGAAATLLNPTTMTVANGSVSANLQSCADDVVWDGSAFTAVGVGTIPATSISAIRVDATGAVLTAKNSLVTGEFYAPARIVGGGSSLLVTNQTAAWLVDTATLTGRSAGDFASDPFGPNNVIFNQIAAPAVAAGDYFMVWSQTVAPANTGDIYGRRMAVAGTLPETSPTFLSGIANSQTAPAAVFDGTNYLVAWVDERPASLPRIYFARTAPDGTVLDPTGIPTPVTDSSLPTARFGLAYGGGTYLVCEVGFCQRISPAGALLGTAFYAGGVDNAVAFDGTQWVLAYNVAVGSTQGIYTQRIGLDGAIVGAPTRISTAFAAARSVSIASDGAGDSVVTFSIGGRAGRARVRADGTIAEAPADLCPTCTSSSTPAVAFGGGQYLLSWTTTDRSDILAARYRDGVQLDQGIPLVGVAGARDASRIAFMGTRFLLAWIDWTTSNDNPGNWDIYGGRITTAGTSVPGKPFAIANSKLIEGDVAMAAGNGQALVAFTRSYANGYRLFGRIVTDDVGCISDADCPDDDLACTQATCTNGSCGQSIANTSCLIGGVCYANGAADPNGSCAICSPVTSQTGFSPSACVPDGGLGNDGGPGHDAASGSGGASSAGGTRGAGGSPGVGGATGAGGDIGAGGGGGRGVGSGGSPGDASAGAGGTSGTGGLAAIDAGAGGGGGRGVGSGGSPGDASAGAGGASGTGGVSVSGTGGDRGEGGALGTGSAAPADASVAGNKSSSSGCSCGTVSKPFQQSRSLPFVFVLFALLGGRRLRRR